MIQKNLHTTQFTA